MKRLYALTVYREKNGRKSYYRISAFAYPKASAVRNFQSALLYGATHGVPVELRPVRLAFDESVPASVTASVIQIADAITCAGCQFEAHVAADQKFDAGEWSGSFDYGEQPAHTCPIGPDTTILDVQDR